MKNQRSYLSLNDPMKSKESIDDSDCEKMIKEIEDYVDTIHDELKKIKLLELNIPSGIKISEHVIEFLNKELTRLKKSTLILDNNNEKKTEEHITTLLVLEMDGDTISPSQIGKKRTFGTAFSSSTGNKVDFINESDDDDIQTPRLWSPELLKLIDVAIHQFTVDICKGNSNSDSSTGSSCCTCLTKDNGMEDDNDDEISSYE